VIHNLYPWVCRTAFNKLPRPIRATIIYDVNCRRFRTDEVDHAQDVRADLVTGNNDRYVGGGIHGGNLCEQAENLPRALERRERGIAKDEPAMIAGAILTVT